MKNSNRPVCYLNHKRRDALKMMGKLGVLSVAPGLLSACGGSSDTQSLSQRAAALGYKPVSVDASGTSSTIRSLQGVDGPPVPAIAGVENIPPGATVTGAIHNPRGLDLTSSFQEMGIDFVRTHDLDALGTGDLDGVNINRIFPDWSADPSLEASYNFGPTDIVIKGIVDSGSAVFFRLGRSDNSMVSGETRDATPPTDFAKFSAVSKQIVLHYNHGWANGFTYGIKYWEVWNEPDLTPFWNGTAAQYFDLYNKVVTAVKSVDATLKVGGPVNESNNDLRGTQGTFLQYVKDNNLPLDFFSFHWYARYVDPLDFSRLATENRALLDKYGFTTTEIHLNEWNYSLQITPKAEDFAAFIAASMTYMQDAPIDRACCYQRTTKFLNDDGSLTKGGLAFSAVGSMKGMFRLTTTGQDDQGFSVLSGASSDRKEVRILISNYEIPPAYMGPIPGGDIVTVPNVTTFTYPDRRTVTYSANGGYLLSLANLPWGTAACAVKRYRIDASNALTLVDTESLSGTNLLLSNSLPVSSVDLIVLTAS